MGVSAEAQPASGLQKLLQVQGAGSCWGSHCLGLSSPAPGPGPFIRLLLPRESRLRACRVQSDGQEGTLGPRPGGEAPWLWDLGAEVFVLDSVTVVQQNYNNHHHNTTMTQPASETPLLAFSAPVVWSGGRGALASCQLVQVCTGPAAGWPVMPASPTHPAAMEDLPTGERLCSSWTEWLSEPRFDVLLGHTPSPFRPVVAGQGTSEAVRRPEQGGRGQHPHRNLVDRDASPS